jgi:succinate dehydrogenase/fumarate reductase flavoprotein subunit
MSGSLLSTDVLVIGGGLAGERCAIEAAAAGHNVLILSLVPPRRSHSCAAQGGMQASLGNCVKADGDNPTLHFLDTVRGSDWGADQEVARIFAEEAQIAVRELAHFGVPWTRVRGGKNSYFIKGERVEIEESIENDGLIMHRDFGGTAKWRACYAAAGTGHAVLYAVDSEVVRLAMAHDAGAPWRAACAPASTTRSLQKRRSSQRAVTAAFTASSRPTRRSTKAWARRSRSIPASCRWATWRPCSSTRPG